MRKVFRVIVWSLAGILLIIQFIPVSFPETKVENKDDLITNGEVPVDIQAVLTNACYDCHSYTTRYPWYSYVAPVKWMIIQHIRDGREELNFSEWKNLPVRDKIKLLDEIAEEVEEGNMPLPVYTLTHRDAVLTDEQKAIIRNWTEQMMNELLGE